MMSLAPFRVSEAKGANRCDWKSHLIKNALPREGAMKISRDKTLVEFKPENDQEVQDLDALWRIIIDCVKDSKKLVPVGEYVPGQSDVARFNIES